MFRGKAFGAIYSISVFLALIFSGLFDSLIEVCQHDAMQAENCALIAHYKGRCPVKNGTVNDLRPVYVEMTNRQITVEIV